MNERDQQLMSFIRTIQEEKEEVKELIAASSENQKKSIWQRLFNR
ncbi:DUF3967 domain-containing protein [Priestia abyssalis]